MSTEESNLEVIPILVMVEHPYPTTLEITPPKDGVFRIHAFKPIQEGDEYYIPKWELDDDDPVSDAKDRLPPMMRGVKITHIGSQLPPIRNFKEVVDLDQVGDEVREIPFTTFSKLAPITLIFEPNRNGPFSMVLFVEKYVDTSYSPTRRPTVTDGPKAVISYLKYQHPTEGLLFRATYHFGHGMKPWQQGWRRCHKDGAPCSAEEAVKIGIDPTGIEFRDDGFVERAPDLLVDVTSGETYGRILGEDGIKIEWGGMCPVQGTGHVDGKTIYYRARGMGWSVDIAEDTPEAWSYEEAQYIWPDGGWLQASVSAANIRKAVAKWREHQKGNRG